MSSAFEGSPKRRREDDTVSPLLIRSRSAALFSGNFCNVTSLSDESEQIVKTPTFQRLRRVAQLGSAQFVFPSATHMRFEHSLGVAELAQKMVLNLNMKQVVANHAVSKEDLVTEADKKMVEIAGLCHDLGHGPFSHLYERTMKTNGIKFCHEVQSVKLFEKIVSELREKGDFNVSDEEVKEIGELITHSVNDVKEEKTERLWLKQIVSNCSNGIDVDRLDYLRRDAYHLHRPLRFTVDKIVEGGVIHDGQICFSSQCRSDIEDLFTQRYLMYKDVYTNKNITAVELLICDILIEAYPYVPILKSGPDDLDSFIQLDDSILNIIRSSKLVGLNKAKELVGKLDRAEFYPLVDSLGQTAENKALLSELSPKTIVDYGKNLKEEDIIVDDLRITVAPKDNWEKINFVKENGEIITHKPSILYPKESETFCRRVYTRSPEKIDEVRYAVKRFVTERQLSGSALFE
ncbi:sam/hd domain protein, putative [Entamoeba invadens IP1]|uniref:sam/hd domain protein, putative n=1 Tax=Entamoeba invadens IP1 TaxID=370355 RepID=UPI0002C3CFB5|nr:sam/hd domain protein, putative [Entamoeba invadens IP1]ELP94193.1 sam/hd domain protein, putative [Entamoeba invadens IP1]|eukprot:XP_004260964.1 sam/hd domain protein, putative [Entamoeba invadens IP1]